MVVLRDGDIRLVKNGTTRDEPFLSIPDVDSASGPGKEQGLLSVAFAPDYRTSRRFYVFLVPDDANPGLAPHGPAEIREYLRSATNPDVADAASGRTVLKIPHTQNSNHYGGTLQFGPDGLLYASVGDGGSGGDPPDNAENTNSRLGKILRLDPRPGAAAPATNPFTGGGGDPLVWSYGLRNPFRFSFDRQTGDLAIGDVGQGDFEEIDFATGAQPGRGAYYGWNTCEGLQAYPDETQPCPTGTLPVHAYSHSTGCSVTGGVVVRDPSVPSLAGKYVFGDLCASDVRSLDFSQPAPLSSTSLPGLTVAGVVAFGEDACGRVHLVELAAGLVRRLGEDTTGSCGLRVTYPGPSVPVTTTPPVVAALAFSLGGAGRQRPLRSGNVGVRVRCDAACSARAIGTLSVRYRGRRVRLRQALAKRASAGTLTLKLRFSKRGRRLLRGALRARRRVSASITVRVRDSAGTLSLRPRVVRLTR